MRKVTIEDISRQTGLSRGTVSRALNDRPDISQSTRDRVLEACVKLNYTPSHAARSLATGRSFAVAVLISDLRCPYAAALLRGAIARAERAQYVVNVVELRGDATRTADRLSQISQERVDSVVLATSVEDEVLTELRERIGLRPIVACAASPRGNEHDQFLPDEREAGRLAARRLLAGGGRDVLFVERPGDSTARREGFLEICASQSIQATAHMIARDRQARRAVQELVERLGRDQRIAAASAAAALQTAVACGMKGLSTGEDVALVAIGDDPLLASIRPSITAVDLSAEEIGRRAMDALLSRLNESRADAPKTVHVPPTLVERESTAGIATP